MSRLPGRVAEDTCISRVEEMHIIVMHIIVMHRVSDRVWCPCRTSGQWIAPTASLPHPLPPGACLTGRILPFSPLYGACQLCSAAISHCAIMASVSTFVTQQRVAQQSLRSASGCTFCMPRRRVDFVGVKVSAPVKLQLSKLLLPSSFNIPIIPALSSSMEVLPSINGFPDLRFCHIPPHTYTPLSLQAILARNKCVLPLSGSHQLLCSSGSVTATAAEPTTPAPQPRWSLPGIRGSTTCHTCRRQTPPGSGSTDRMLTPRWVALFCR